jgi:hypothetical protein
MAHIVEAPAEFNPQYHKKKKKKKARYQWLTPVIPATWEA